MTARLAAPCRPISVGNPDGNYIVPGVQSAIPYTPTDRQPLRLDAFVPAGSRGRPPVLVVHGGGYVSGSRAAYVGQWLELLSDAGIPWFSVDYRLDGFDNRELSIDDVGDAVGFIRCNAPVFGIDANRIVVLGEDTGAEIALTLLERRTPGLAGAISVGGRFTRGLDTFAPRGGAVLFVHGDRDDEQPAAHVRAWCRSNRRRGDTTCGTIDVADGIHRAENWRPEQWSYKAKLISWLATHGVRGAGMAQGGAVGAAVRPWPSQPLAAGLHKRLVWDSERPLTLDAWIPAGSAPHPFALIVHGGGWEAGDRVTYVTPLFEPLAAAGIAWVSIDYRLTPDVRHPAQLDDLRRAIAFIREHAAALHIDPARIVLVGESASAQMATLVASNDHALAGVVSFYGVYDFEPLVNDSGPRSLASRLFDSRAFDDETRRTLRAYSPIYQARSGMPPVLLVHGTAESLWAQGVAYERRLSELGVPHALVRLEGAPHGMENWEGRAEWQWYKERVTRFVRTPRHLN